MEFLYSQNNLLILVVAVLSGIMLLLPAFTKNRNGRPIGPSEAVAQMNQHDAVIIDIRSADQFKAAHIAQAQNVQLADLESRSNHFAKDKPIVVVCEQGRTSSKAVATLRKLGFDKVFSLDKGLQGWIEAGLPVRKS